jgi:hypothetical protein
LAIRFTRSASRHGIGEDRARHVVEHCPDPIYPTPAAPGESDRILFLGPDQHGVPLEVLAIELPDGDMLVFHVMKLRRRYRDDFRRVME